MFVVVLIILIYLEYWTKVSIESHFEKARPRFQEVTIVEGRTYTSFWKTAVLPGIPPATRKTRYLRLRLMMYEGNHQTTCYDHFFTFKW